MQQRPIQRLADEVIGQIAAGEVVERPAAAVKELVENSIDAGATAITVELQDGGIRYIRVSDNGAGIPAGQVRMAFERHATSKLMTAEDLFDVRTLGFRGEALASIAAVGKVSCTTRTADAEYGVRAQVDAGMFLSLSEAAAPVGTTIVVKELFYNAPVRLKFLKKPALETSFVSDYIMRLILSHPEIAFRFVNQGKTIYRSAGDGTLDSAVYCVYGRDALRAMRKVDGTRNGVVMAGLIGVGELSRGNRMQQSFFINGRYFRDDLLSKALENACEGFVMIGRFPMCVLSLQLPFRQVDVNVHPNKLEVRFQNPEAVARAVQELTREALHTVTFEGLLTATNAETGEPAQDLFTLQPTAPDGSADAGEGVSGFTAVPEASSRQPEEPNQPQPMTQEETISHGSDLGDGTIRKAEPLSMPLDQSSAKLDMLSFTPYVQMPTTVFREGLSIMLDSPSGEASSDENETPAERFTIDSEGAVPNTEADDLRLTRETFNTIPASIAEDRAQTRAISEAQSEQMAFPKQDARFHLRYIGAVFQTYLLFEANDRLLMVDQHAAHERVLFDRFMARYEDANSSQRLLTPQIVRLTARDVLQLAEMADALTEAGFDVEPFDATSVAVRALPVILGTTPPTQELILDVLDEAHIQHGHLTRERLRRRVAQMACKHAIKGGDTLTDGDVRGLLTQMLETGAQPTCPHGRPIVSEWTRRELEKRFKRIP